MSIDITSPTALVNSVSVIKFNWDRLGPESDPDLKLKTVVSILGATFHVEAYRVRQGDNGQEIDSTKAEKPEHEDHILVIDDSFQELLNVFMPDSGFATVDINSKPYVLIISPESIT